MRKVIWISGILTVLFLPFILTGMADADDAAKKALQQGNLQYASAEYDGALKTYEVGLGVNPDNKALNFNAAQSAYMLGQYEKAVEYYGKSADSTERYINAGNAVYKLGEASQDPNQQMEYYMGALETYYNGIIKYPQNVQLKYNFETLKKIIEELIKEQEQENNEQSDGEGDESQEEQEQSESGDSQEQSESGDNQEQEQEESGDSQEQEQAEESNEDKDEEQQQGSEQEESSEQEEGSEQEESYGDSEESGEEDLDQQAIERILQMLESQEETSLKNNQEVKGGGDGKYGW